MIIDGKKIADEIQQEIRTKVEHLSHRPPCLAVILVGQHPPSQIYIHRKTQACQEVGIHSLKRELPEAISEEHLLEEIKKLNEDPGVDGILVQLPLPNHINPNHITHFINPEKDVDGFNPYNVGRMLTGESQGFVPCTPLGIKVLMERYSIETTGKHALIIGRSNIVGKPMAALLMQGAPGGNATVTIAHRYSIDLKKFCLLADILVVAIGQPKFITEDMVKEGAVVIDVGINKVLDSSKKSGYRIVGDVDFDHVAPKCSFITPVPGGVGPMTIAMLLHNTLQSYQQRMKNVLNSTIGLSQFPLLFFIFSLFFLQGCQSPSSASRKPIHFSQNVMTIDYHISIGDPISSSTHLQIQKVIDATFQEINAVYNKWNPSSELSQLNSLPAHTPQQLSPQLYQFFQRVDALVKLSGGRFDPTIEPIQQLWKAKLEKGILPTQFEIEALRPYIGWQTLQMANGIFYKEYAQTQLDLGGVAKGYCVDLLLERLRSMGLNHLYIEWGGEIRTLGFHPSQRPWRVFISRLSNSNPSQAIAKIDLIDRALATSGDYYQNWKIKTTQGEEKIYCHIINPQTLNALEVKTGSVASASLLALDCMTADALAKVLMLFNSPEEAHEWMNQLQSKFPYLACWIAARE